jgi:hypothetical protein
MCSVGMLGWLLSGLVRVVFVVSRKLQGEISSLARRARRGDGICPAWLGTSLRLRQGRLHCKGFAFSSPSSGGVTELRRSMVCRLRVIPASTFTSQIQPLRVRDCVVFFGLDDCKTRRTGMHIIWPSLSSLRGRKSHSA